jgi:signal transduction histidine kinase/CHASE1-domain containing sensor protein
MNLAQDDSWKRAVLRLSYHAFIPPLILLAGILLTLLVSGYTYYQLQERNRARFEIDVETTREALTGSLENYIALLHAQAGYFTAENTQVTSAEFYRFAERLNLHERYPGAQGIGLSLAIPPLEKSSFENQMKQKWGPEFSILPNYQRDEYHSIIYLAPLDKRNQAAIGYDMFTDPVRRLAMMQARDSGMAVMSGKVTLVQEIDDDIQAGFLIYVPIYTYPGIPETPEERHKYFYGFAYSPFRAGDFFNSIKAQKLNPNVHFSVYDGTEVSPDTLLFQSTILRERENHLSPSLFTASKQLDIAGHTWTLQIYSNNHLFEDTQYRNPVLLVLGGMVFSVSLYSLSRIQYRAQRMAYRAETALYQRLQMQKAVANLGQEALLETKLSDFMAKTVTELAQKLNVEFAKILEYQVEKHEFVLRAGYGWGPHIQTNTTTVPSDNASQAGYTFSTQGPVVVDDLSQEKRFTGPNLLTTHGVQSGMSVVIYGKHNRKYGILSAHSSSTRRFTKDDLEYLKSIANILSLSIQRHQIDVERKKYEQLKDDFIAVASHELKTPVTSIKAFAYVLSKHFNATDNQRAVRILERLNNQVDRLTFLVTSLLDISKIEAGKLMFHYSWFDYDELVKQTAQSFQLTASTHAITFASTVLTKVYGDKDRLEQVLINLIGNAVKYSPPGSEVMIRTNRVANTIQTFVTDFGIGIPPHEYDRIFERFYRVQEIETQTFSGLGLGLYISAQIIKRLGGTISLESKPGKGTTFCFTIPIEPSSKTA